MNVSPIVAITEVKGGRSVRTLYHSSGNPFLDWVFGILRGDPYESVVAHDPTGRVLEKVRYSTRAAAEMGHQALVEKWLGKS